MHGRMAKYTYTGDAQELARTAEEGILPIFQGMPGFKSYSIVANEDALISFSAWESAEDAEEANKAIASWVAENMADKVELIETQIGEIYVATALGVSTKAGITA
jgi:heme-degrading monooxygenase HmoA